MENNTTVEYLEHVGQLQEFDLPYLREHKKTYKRKSDGALTKGGYNLGYIYYDVHGERLENPIKDSVDNYEIIIED